MVNRTRSFRDPVRVLDRLIAPFILTQDGLGDRDVGGNVDATFGARWAGGRTLPFHCAPAMAWSSTQPDLA